MEVFKPIPRYENKYEISNLGRIKSLPKLRCKNEKILKPIIVGGYACIDLGDGQTIKRFLIHRLVAITFLKNPQDKPQVNHIDGDKLNNNLSNLEWNTCSENQLHSIKIGLRTTKGVKNSQSKLKESDVIEIFNDKRQYKHISKDYNVSIPTISDIKRGYSWTHLTNLKNRKQILVVK